MQRAASLVPCDPGKEGKYLIFSFLVVVSCLVVAGAYEARAQQQAARADNAERALALLDSVCARDALEGDKALKVERDKRGEAESAARLLRIENDRLLAQNWGN